VTKSLAQERKLIKPLQAVDVDFVSFSSESHEFTAWADLEIHNLVGIRDLCDRLSLVAVPEKDRAS